ncbi:MAG: hypothetical protein JWQ43_770, partial [Glaciihabitans sp.]|nr:hypothetical protein [Glaciihabitans sp.]
VDLLVASGRSVEYARVLLPEV